MGPLAVDLAFAAPLLFGGLLPLDMMTVLAWFAAFFFAARAALRLLLKAPMRRREALRIGAFVGAIVLQMGSVVIAKTFVADTVRDVQAQCDAAGACPAALPGWEPRFGGSTHTAGLLPVYSVSYQPSPDLQSFYVGVRFTINMGEGWRGGVGRTPREHVPGED